MSGWEPTIEAVAALRKNWTEASAATSAAGSAYTNAVVAYYQGARRAGTPIADAVAAIRAMSAAKDA